MFSTCLFCNGSLGRNEVLETFPVGRRIAFDPAKGRLWVICRKCERWNLSPIEERWEAVEQCERIFRETRIRVSTDNIGMARHPEGLELVRIGEPMRPEFAAWRYGDQFGRRRKRAIAYGVGGVVVIGGLVIGGVATGVISGGILGQSGNFVNLFINGRTLARVRAPDGKLLKLRNRDLRSTRIEYDGDDMALVLPPGRRRRLGRHREYRFEGEDAHRVAGVLVSRINRAGAHKQDVQEAVRLLDAHGSPEAVLHAAAGQVPQRIRPRMSKKGQVAGLGAPTRLAVEMALHEEQERRALEGELWRLERAWKEAEEIAAISDSLLLPEGTEEFLESHREPEEG
jgi:hypothetical protein